MNEARILARPSQAQPPQPAPVRPLGPYRHTRATRTRRTACAAAHPVSREPLQQHFVIVARPPLALFAQLGYSTHTAQSTRSAGFAFWLREVRWGRCVARKADQRRARPGKGTAARSRSRRPFSLAALDTRMVPARLGPPIPRRESAPRRAPRPHRAAPPPPRNFSLRPCVSNLVIHCGRALRNRPRLLLARAQRRPADSAYSPTAALFGLVRCLPIARPARAKSEWPASVAGSVARVRGLSRTRSFL
jgi:hypothetical protein